MDKFMNEVGLVTIRNWVKGKLTGKANTADLASVATSGSYNDLVDTPTPYDDTALAARVTALENTSGGLPNYTSAGAFASGANVVAIPATAKEFALCLKEGDKISFPAVYARSMNPSSIGYQYDTLGLTGHLKTILTFAFANNQLTFTSGKAYSFDGMTYEIYDVSDAAGISVFYR